MRGLVALGLVALGALSAGGCSGRVAHAFGGYAYDTVNDCLSTSGAIDVIAGADPGTYPLVRCWQAPDGSTYVTDQACDAPPDYQDDTNAASGPCVKALAAYARPGHGLCAGAADAGADGG